MKLLYCCYKSEINADLEMCQIKLKTKQHLNTPNIFQQIKTHRSKVYNSEEVNHFRKRNHIK